MKSPHQPPHLTAPDSISGFRKGLNMETTAASTPAPILPQGPASPTNDVDKPVLSSDFETFLKMLTVQMENQDPLNPMQSSDFAVQLATFSAVEQQVQTNQLLENFLSAQGVGGLGELSGWVGKEARAQVATKFDGPPIPVYADIPDTADQATVVVRDDTGSVVSRFAISPSDTEIEWNGKDAGGATAAEGFYSFSIELASGGTPMTPIPAEVYARVTEVRLEGGTPVLGFESGDTLAPEEATGLRSI